MYLAWSCPDNLDGDLHSLNFLVHFQELEFVTPLERAVFIHLKEDKTCIFCIKRRSNQQSALERWVTSGTQEWAFIQEDTWSALCSKGRFIKLPWALDSGKLPSILSQHCGLEDKSDLGVDTGGHSCTLVRRLSH